MYKRQLTLGALTLTATGHVQVSGTAAITLGVQTLLATGSVQIQANASLSLDAFTLTGHGMVAVPPSLLVRAVNDRLRVGRAVNPVLR